MKEVDTVDFECLLELHQEFYHALLEQSNYNFASGEHDTGFEIAAALMVIASQFNLEDD